MVLIEVYDVSSSKDDDPSEFPSGYAFRLIYNGAVLTSRMDGCSAELCDSQVLVDQVMPFAMFEERDCASTQPESKTFDDTEEDTIPEPKQNTAESGVNPRQKWGIFGVAILSAAIGSVTTCFMMRHHYQIMAYRQASSLERELSMVENTDDTNYGTSGSSRNDAISNAGVSSDYVEESDEDRII
jgi:ubiquitin-like domain-containing CTD phosphatase 1